MQETSSRREQVARLLADVDLFPIILGIDRPDTERARNRTVFVVPLHRL